jgi:hypothetical protein
LGISSDLVQVSQICGRIAIDPAGEFAAGEHSVGRWVR